MIIVRDQAGYLYLEPEAIAEMRAASGGGAMLRLRDQTGWRTIRETPEQVCVLRMWWGDRPRPDTNIYAVMYVAGKPVWRVTE